MQMAAKSLAIALSTAGVMLFASTASHAFCFEEAAARYGVAPQLLWSIAKNESGFNPNAIGKNKNGSHDLGLMQINSSWAPTLKKMGISWSNLYDPCLNVQVGAWILANQVQKHGYNWKAIGSYHSGTPELRDRYAAKIAKTIATVRPPAVAVQHQQNQQRDPKPETLAQIAWGSPDALSAAN